MKRLMKTGLILLGLVLVGWLIPSGAQAYPAEVHTPRFRPPGNPIFPEFIGEAHHCANLLNDERLTEKWCRQMQDAMVFDLAGNSMHHQPGISNLYASELIVITQDLNYNDSIGWTELSLMMVLIQEGELTAEAAILDRQHIRQADEIEILVIYPLDSHGIVQGAVVDWKKFDPVEEPQEFLRHINTVVRTGQPQYFDQ